MTKPEEAVTVGELVEFLSELDDDVPVAVAASGAYDFLHGRGLKTSELKRGGDVAYLDGDRQKSL